MYNPTPSRLKPKTGLILNDTLANSMVVSSLKLHKSMFQKRTLLLYKIFKIPAMIGVILNKM